MTGDGTKITAGHLARAACVYVRQSSPGQVRNNLESQHLQYGLQTHAKGLGWRTVEVIDEDLGRSGGGNIERPGFQKLLTAVCDSRIGIVMSVDASRLANSGAAGAAPRLTTLKASSLQLSRLTATLHRPLSTLHDARCRAPCKTRFRPAGCAFAGRGSNPLGRFERFQINSSSFPGLRLALGQFCTPIGGHSSMPIDNQLPKVIEGVKFKDGIQADETETCAAA